VGSARIDPGQAESAIVNLALNARDAMPRGGQLLIETQNFHHDSAARPHLEVPPGEYVQIIVTDTGSGMNAEVRERAIEPFFTTKPRGHGTGLGLSMVYGFARQAGGNIEIISSPEGSTIKIYLPRSSEAVPADVGEVHHDEEEQPPARVILVVEDDAQVRKLTISRLRKLGYNTENCADGAAAIARLVAGERFDLVFSDVVMPGGVTGYDVVMKARALDSNIPVLLTSGYAEDLIGGNVPADVLLLRKPYKLEELKAMLKEILS
jgi:CheY-like chemotaxis protein